MKSLKNFISEGLKLGSSKIKVYTEHPETYKELKSILKERLKKDKNADLNDIDVSEIEDMLGLFEGLDPHNIKIDQWDVSKVINMRCMFQECKSFEGKGLEKWDVSSVEDIGAMFYECENFNADISSWNVSNIEKMSQAFYGCKKFDADLSGWILPKIDKEYKKNDTFFGCPLSKLFNKQPKFPNLK